MHSVSAYTGGFSPNSSGSSATRTRNGIPYAWISGIDMGVLWKGGSELDCLEEASICAMQYRAFSHLFLTWSFP
jgi:hypothetical protein